MTNIVHNPGQSHIEDVFIQHFQLRLSLTDVFHDLLRQVTCAKTVLKAIVRGSRINEVRSPKLLDLPESLELRSVNEAPTV